ncbi:caspase family protein [Hyalangium sp.]|uniref:caspase family protein n=1 Tax=Hyalangium sp. TaxID=2028555 RepID=UPI002D64D066|nr:caspase family protein [Hyalangium sp.]HYH97039.1 caspase family protein [Hyalangium sp.]
MNPRRWMSPLPCLLLLVPTLCMAAPRERFVLIVGNNTSATLGRPPLQFADDDAAKYDTVFRLLAPEANVRVLTELDKDTARLFPEVQQRAEPPTRVRLRHAFEEISERAREAAAQGRESELFFLFAGHGDVEKGKGFLELADGAFTADELEEALSQVPVQRAHVVLDSCNSFFVLNPRKPGGRRYATPTDSAEAMGRRLPHVGVLLSTSAEAEVYEWSELQSGIFSHAVRSGLLGAADADGDGAVNYEELAAFVDTASREVKNPAFRPRVFARGPAGDNQTRLIELSSSGAAVLDVDGKDAVRLVVRDAEGLRWIDSHSEAGHRVRLSLPPATQGGSVERVLEGGRSERLALPEGGVTLASLSAVAGGPEPRGPAEPLRALFAQPFGPRALTAFQSEQAQAPAPVYGISRDDSERMGLLLGQLGRQQRQRRRYEGAFGLAGGAAFGLAGGLNLRAGGYEASTWTYLTAGVFLAGVGTWTLLSTSEGEEVEADYRRGLLANEDRAHLVALTEERLRSIAEAEKRKRFLVKVSSAFTLATGAAFTVWQETSRPPLPENYGRSLNRMVGPALMLAGTGALLNAFLQSTPTEHVLEAWSVDPERRDIPLVSVSLLPKGGLMLGLSGQF